MSANPLPRITAEEYLALERAAEFKSEYYDGVMYAMSGGLLPHAVISAALVAELRAAIRNQGCTAAGSDLRIGVTPKGPFFYPDGIVYCGEPLLADEYKDMLLNPTLVFEVPSASSEAFDRGKKFAAYRRIGSLKEYALVSQTEPVIEIFFKDPVKGWTLSEFSGLDTTCKFSSLDIEIPLAEIYRGVKLEPSSVYYG